MGNCPPTLGAGYRRLVPAPRFGLSSGGKFGPGWLLRHLPPDVGSCAAPPVRTQEAAELSSDCWKAHLQASAKTNSYKTVVVFHCTVA